MTTTRKTWTDHIQAIPGPDADAEAIARGLHDIANAIRGTKPKKIGAVVNITDQDVKLGEDLGREAARVLAGPAPTKEEIRQELMDLPEGVEVVLDPPRTNYHTSFGEAEGPVSRVYVDSPGRFRFEMEGEQHDFHWHTRAKAVQQLGLTAADFSLPKDKLEPFAEAKDEGDLVYDVKHYQKEGIECIELNHDLTGPWFSIVRYVFRCMDKGNPVQDLDKALNYIDIAEHWGQKKPVNEERWARVREPFMSAPYGSIEESVWYTLMVIFAADEDSDQVRDEIEHLIDLIERGQE